MKRVLVFALLFFVSCVSFGKESRILFDGLINGKPVKLALDTGASGPILFRTSSERLGLAIKEKDRNTKVEKGEVQFDLTEKCKFQMYKSGYVSEMHFCVVDVPAYLTKGLDGVMGWGSIKHTMLQIDSLNKKTIIREKIDFDKSKWNSLEIRDDINVLVVNTSSKDKTQDFLLIDTGSPDGLTVRKALWDQLTGETYDAKTTVSAGYTPGLGLEVREEKWLQRVGLGGLKLKDVPVKKGLDTNKALVDRGVDGVLGMWGLSCYDWIIDGPNGKMYYRKNELVRVPKKYEYNRLGAAFVPEDIRTSSELKACVVKDGPAYKAGIRDGDELLKIGELDVTRWRSDPGVLPLRRFWSKAAGTRHELVIKQNGKIKKVTVTLEEIFDNGTGS